MHVAGWGIWVTWGLAASFAARHLIKLAATRPTSLLPPLLGFLAAATIGLVGADLAHSQDRLFEAVFVGLVWLPVFVFAMAGAHASLQSMQAKWEAANG